MHFLHKPNTMVSGKRLSVDWDGAQVSGGFGLATGNQRGQFGFDLNFSDVDAVERPLAQWLPLSVMDDELRDGCCNCRFLIISVVVWRLALLFLCFTFTG